MHIVIFAGGTLRPGRAVDEAIATADLIIAADRGAETALQYHCTPAIVVGDFDSLRLPVEQLEALGSQLVRVAIEKEETDTELALLVAQQEGASAITLLGGLGGARFEHTMANVLLLASWGLEPGAPPLRLVDGPSICRVLHGPGKMTIEGEAGDLLSLFPLTGDAVGITTTNLYYPLTSGTLYFGKPRGVSNALTGTLAEVELESGILLVIYTSARELDES